MGKNCTQHLFGKTERNKERKIWENLGVNLRIMILSVSSRVTMGTGSFSGVKRPGRGVDHLPHLAPRLKKEYSYTSTPPLGVSWPVLG
jgi:hypothetical protein